MFRVRRQNDYCPTDLTVLREVEERPKLTLAHRRARGILCRSPHGSYDRRMKPQHSENLRHPRSADAVSPRDLGPVVHHAVVEKVLELLGEVEGVEVYRGRHLRMQERLPRSVVPPNVPGDTGHDPGVPPDVPGDIDLDERRAWIVAQTGKRAEVQRRTVQEELDVSAKTAKRDLSQLVKRGLVEHTRRPHPGFYRQKQ